MAKVIPLALHMVHDGAEPEVGASKIVMVYCLCRLSRPPRAEVVIMRALTSAPRNFGHSGGHHQLEDNEGCLNGSAAVGYWNGEKTL